MKTEQRHYVSGATKDQVIHDAQNALVEMVPVHDPNGSIIDGFDLIRDVQTGAPIQIFSGRFAPVQHIDVVNQTFSELDAHIGEGKYEIVDWKLLQQEKRSQMKMTVTLPVFDEFDVDGSGILPIMNIRNSNDGSCSLNFDVGGWRMVCSNGLSIFKDMQNLLRKRHTNQFVFEALNFEAIAEQYQVLERMITKSQEVVINDEIKKIFISSGFSKKVINDLPSFFERYDEAVNEQIKDFSKLWALYAVLTNWITNVVEKKNIVMAQHYAKQLNKAMTASLPII
jgi:hypothetical protein